MVLHARQVDTLTSALFLTELPVAFALVLLSSGAQGSGNTASKSMSRIGAWPPCSGIHAGPQAGQVTCW